MAALVKGVQHMDANIFKDMSYAGKTQKSYFYFAKWENKDVVIKIPEELKDDDNLDNFKHEIRIMAIFKECSHTVQLVGTTQIETKIAFVMERLSYNLTEFLQDKTQMLTWPKKGWLARQIAQAIACMHKCGVLHGDIKSRNILLNESHEVKLCDFGYAFLKSDPGGVLIKNQLKATLSCSPCWVQPERLSNYSYPYDEACDVFSFGIVMWEIAERSLPHVDAKNWTDIQMMRLQKKHEPLSRDTHPVYAAWTNKARDFNPELRPSAQQIAEGLKDFNN